MATDVKMMPTHRAKLMNGRNINEEFRSDATKTMTSHQVHKGHKGSSFGGKSVAG